MTNDEIKARAQGLYTLASQCRVAMLPACRAIGMATSTPHRWLHLGTQTTEQAMLLLRHSILRCAVKRGTLPDQHRAEFDQLEESPPPRQRPVREIVRDAVRIVRELEQHTIAEG